MNDDQILELVKAVWASGFWVGRGNGTDDAFQYEQTGFGSEKPQDAEGAWKEDVQWRIDTDTSSHLDIRNPESWKNVPSKDFDNSCLKGKKRKV